MSGLAMLFLREGFTVSGSDSTESGLTERLRELGAMVTIGQSAGNITEDIDVVIYTAAIRDDNPELARAKEAGLPLLTRAELLGQVMRNYRVPIAVAGTHGKTTTTSMAAHVLLAADLDPTVSVGGMLPAIGGNFRVGAHETILVEACEYKNSFFSFAPRVGMILNIEADHLDFFKDLDDVRASFRHFAGLIPEEGTLIINTEIPDLDAFTADLSCRVMTYGLDPASDISASDITYDEFGRASFTALYGGAPVGHYNLKVPGEHNVSNALAVIAMGFVLDIPPSKVSEGLSDFTGTDRRFQIKGEVRGITIVDDYAHHPTEIKATLTAAAAHRGGEIWCVFQPHTYTRTKALLPEFAKALSLADKVILADIYAAREKDEYGISSDDLRAAVDALGTEAWYLPTFEEIETFVSENCKSGDLLITMGAGNIVEVGEHLLSDSDTHHD